MGNDISSLHATLYEGLPDRERQVWSRPGPRSREARRNQGSSTRPSPASGAGSQQRSRQPSRHPSQRQPGRNIQDYKSQKPIYNEDYTSEDEEDSDYVTASVGSRGRRGDPVVGAPSLPSQRPNRQPHPPHPGPPNPHLTSPRSSHPHPAGLSSRPHPPSSSHYPASAAPDPQDQPHRHHQPRNPPTAPADIVNIGPGRRGEGGGRYKGAAPELSIRNRERASSRQESPNFGGRRERESSGATHPHRHLSPRPGPRGESNRRSRDPVLPVLSSRPQPPFPESHPKLPKPLSAAPSRQQPESRPKAPNPLSAARSHPPPSHHPLPSATPRPQSRNAPTAYAGAGLRGERGDNEREKSAKRKPSSSFPKQAASTQESRKGPSSSYLKRAVNDQGSRKGVELSSAANPKSNPNLSSRPPPSASHDATSSSAPRSREAHTGRAGPGLRVERNDVDKTRNARPEPPTNLSKRVTSRPEIQKAGENLGVANLSPLSAAAPYSHHAPTAPAKNPNSGLEGGRDNGDRARYTRPEPPINLSKPTTNRAKSQKAGENSGAANPNPESLFPLSAAAPHSGNAPTANAINPGSGLGGKRDDVDRARNAKPAPSLSLSKRAVYREGSLKAGKGSSAANIDPLLRQQPPPPPFHSRSPSMVIPSLPAAHPHHLNPTPAPAPRHESYRPGPQPPPRKTSHEAPSSSAPQSRDAPTRYTGPGLKGEPDDSDSDSITIPDPPITHSRLSTHRHGTQTGERREGSSAANPNPNPRLTSSRQQPPPLPPVPFHTRPLSFSTAIPPHVAAPAMYSPPTSYHVHLSSAPAPGSRRGGGGGGDDRERSELPALFIGGRERRQR